MTVEPITALFVKFFIFCLEFLFVEGLGFQNYFQILSMYFFHYKKKNVKLLE